MKDRRLSGVKLLSDMPSGALHELEGKCRWAAFEPNEVVLEREDDTREVYFVAKGHVRIMNFVSEDREVTLAELATGDHFGELSAVGPRERTARVIALDHCLLAAVSREDFIALLLDHPRVSLRLLHQLAFVIRSMNQRVSALSTLAPRQRIYLELLRLAVPHPKGDGRWIIESLPNHNEIASWAGTDKHEVALAIGTLAREEILERRNKALLIKDRSRLRMLADM